MYWSEANGVAITHLSFNIKNEKAKNIHIKYNNGIEGDMIIDANFINSIFSCFTSPTETPELYVTDRGCIAVKLNGSELDICPDVVYFYIAKTGKFHTSTHDGEHVIFEDFDFNEYCNWNISPPDIIEIIVDDNYATTCQSHTIIKYANGLHGEVIIEGVDITPYLNEKALHLKNMQIEIDYQKMYYDIATKEKHIVNII